LINSLTRNIWAKLGFSRCQQMHFLPLIMFWTNFHSKFECPPIMKNASLKRCQLLYWLILKCLSKI
jgi:hypothetical protein